LTIAKFQKQQTKNGNARISYALNCDYISEDELAFKRGEGGFDVLDESEVGA
jgi:hypothetical protein